MKFKTTVGTVGNGKGFIIPKPLVYDDGSNIKKCDKVIVEIRRVDDDKDIKN